MKRRSVIAGAAAVSGLASLGLAAVQGTAARPQRPSPQSLPARIAFGACAKQDQPQPIWDAINELTPDLFVFLGDNVYGDTRDMSLLRAKYAQLAAQPGFRRLCERTPVLATWDDHDYGEDDAGAEYPLKEESRQIFCDFWGEPLVSPRRHRDGIYDALLLGKDERRLQILLPDLRFNRTPIRRLDLGGKPYKEWSKQLERAGAQVPGPYERNPESSATMLGQQQWMWLEDQLRQPAALRLFASSLQVIADFPGWEAWVNYARDHQRLLALIRSTNANGLICISGDTHYGELSLLDLNTPYPLWDLTSSGLTEVWPVVPPNALRIGEIVQEPNFGWIEIDWQDPMLPVTLQVRNRRGEIKIEQRVMASELRA
jgi:alkaline phosphatase D